MLYYTEREGGCLQPWPAGVPWPEYEDLSRNPIGFRHLMKDHQSFCICGIDCHALIVLRGEPGDDDTELLWRWDALHGINKKWWV